MRGEDRRRPGRPVSGSLTCEACVGLCGHDLKPEIQALAMRPLNSDLVSTLQLRNAEQLQHTKVIESNAGLECPEWLLLSYYL